MLTVKYPDWRSNMEPPLVPGEEIPFDWSNLISMELIREHTKTDDVPGVTDVQLRLYRAVAIDAAQHYTGFLLTGQRNVTEPVEGPSAAKLYKSSYKIRLQYPVSDGIVYIYGGLDPAANHPLYIKPNTRTLHVPVRYGMVDLSNCCDPCSRSPAVNGGMMACYKAGYKCVEDVPPGVILGCLQFIAWVIEHPGDEVLTVRNRRDARSEGAMGTNNIAIASGALETWRILDEDVV